MPAKEGFNSLCLHAESIKLPDSNTRKDPYLKPLGSNIRKVLLHRHSPEIILRSSCISHPIEKVLLLQTLGIIGVFWGYTFNSPIALLLALGIICYTYFAFRPAKDRMALWLVVALSIAILPGVLKWIIK